MARKVRRAAKRSISPLTWVAGGCGCVVLLGLIAIGAVYLLAVAKPPPPREAARSSHQPSATSTQPTDTGGASVSGAPSPSAPATGASAQPVPPPPDLEAQLARAREAGRSPQPVRVRLVIGEGELNSYVARHAGRGEVQDVHVYFGEGTVAATGRVSWRGRKVYVTIRAHPTISDGDVYLIVDDLSVGRLPAPAALSQDAQRQLNRALDEFEGRQRFYAESVQVTPGTMIIEGTAGGAR